VADVRPARVAERDLLADMLAAAFADDPLFVWWFTDESTRPARLRAIMHRLVTLRLDGGEVWVALDGLSAALWNAPGGLALDQDVVDSGWRDLFATATDDERARGKVFEEIAERWHPGAPHWYLGVLGTEPTRQGEGLATAVLQPVLERCDADGLPAYLETLTPRNVPFYRRRGFAVLGEEQVPDGPNAWFMWREPGAGPQTS
jgi:GNAT superfamily N-acetyltransferase